MRIVLHIGIEKTGTTAIQEHCAFNAPALLKKAVLYPEGFGARNHSALVPTLVSAPDMLAWLGLPPEIDQPAFRADAAVRLKRAVEQARPDVLLLSSEHFSSRLMSVEPIREFRAMLSALSEEIRIVVYLRRQDELLLSLYSTFLKSGETGGPDIVEARVKWFDFDWMLNLWEPEFGIENIAVRRYPPPGGVRLIDDFFAACGLPSIGQSPAGKTANPALDHRNAALLEAMNHYIPAFIDGRANPTRRHMVQFFERRLGGPDLSLTLEERRALFERYRASNARVAARHFPGQAELFAPPANVESPRAEVGYDDAIALAADIWAFWADRALDRDSAAASTLAGQVRRAGRLLRRITPSWRSPRSRQGRI